jgi:sarcosine oxidase subunit gamma
MSATMNSPATLDAAAVQAHQGPLHARLAPLATAWREHQGYAVCTQVRGAVASHGPWLACLSHLARIGFKGRGTADWLEAEGVAVPAAPNRWRRDASGALIARLGAQDFLIADDLDGASGLPQRLAASWHSAAQRGAYPVPRQHGLVTLALGGERTDEVLARLCAVDLSAHAFDADAIAQTQLALTSAIVMRSAVTGPPGYRIYVDTSLALYVWDVLDEVAQSLGGGVLGEAQIPRA